MKRVLLFLAVIVVIVVGGVYLYLDSIVKTAIEDYGSEILGVEVKVQSVHVTLPDEITIEGLVVGNPKEFKAPHSINAKHITIRMPVKSLFGDLIHIDEILIDEPHLFYENNQNTTNFSVLESNAAKRASNEDNKSGTNQLHKHDTDKRIIVSHLLIKQGRVTLHWNGAVKQSIALSNIDINNIGKDEHGITIADASARVLDEVVSSLTMMRMKTIATDVMDKISKVLGQ